MIVGGCACEAIRYTYDGNPILSYKCHCLDCQKYSSSGYVALFWAWSDSFEFTTGMPEWHKCHGSSGKEVSRGFCSKCGSPVATRLAVLPYVVGVAASSLDDISVFRPEYETWVSRVQSWDVLDSSLAKLEGNFTSEILRDRLSRARDA